MENGHVRNVTESKERIEYMRILHTADWHLGKTMEGRERTAEQQQFIDEICTICESEAIDLVLLAGDIFHTANPSAAAEEMFYDALDKLANQGKRAVVAIAGNHDNPERLCAPGPLADRMGISLVGFPKDEIVPASNPNEDRVRRVASGPSWLEVAIPGCDHNAVIAALPYPSEGRLRQLIAQSLTEEELQQGYNKLISSTMSQLAVNYRSDTINLAMSHVFVRGGLESGDESEALIQQVGGTYAVDPSSFPSCAQYIALGHLHRPQAIGGKVPGRYAGSPLQYSFGEAGQAKSVTIIEAVPGEPAVIHEVFLKAGKPLVKWRATGGLAEVHRWIDEGRDANSWIDLEVSITQPLTIDEIHSMRAASPNIVKFRPLFKQAGQQQTVSQESERLSPEQMFVKFFQNRHEGAQPDTDLINLFLELTQEDDSEEQEVKEELNETA